MALQGTLEDFTLPEILQLIGMQRKTGVLRLESGKDSVTIQFQDGLVVSTDTRAESLECRLGAVLVRTGRITEEQLESAIATQRQTLQRLGHILVESGRISVDELVEALRIQATQIIHRLFRWHEGHYHFLPAQEVEFDRSHFTPISPESILMEGAKMVDEWPLIMRRVRSDTMVPQASAKGRAALSGEGVDVDRPAGSALTPDEREILLQIDGRRTVREICDRLPFTEFETFRQLADLMTRGIVEEVVVKVEARSAAPAGYGSRAAAFLALGGITLAVAAGLAGLGGNPLTPWRSLAWTESAQRMSVLTAMARLERLEGAVEVFYLETGRFPKELSELAERGYVRTTDLRDPWAQPFAYELSPGGYQLAGRDERGRARPELRVSRRLSAVRTLLAAGSEGSPR